MLRSVPRQKESLGQFQNLTLMYYLGVQNRW